LKADNLQEEILIQLEAMAIVVDELLALQQDVTSREPTLREKTAAAAFLAQFYNGIENILKRISNFQDIPLPIGETWHVELFQRFTFPSHPGLPVLFDDELADSLAPYRRFRHVVFHSYGFQLEWDKMAGGVNGVSNVFNQFQASLSAYLATVND
jgi:hypothetical protein